MLAEVQVRETGQRVLIDPMPERQQVLAIMFIPIGREILFNVILMAHGNNGITRQINGIPLVKIIPGT
jgi:hypothetical protein